MGDLNTGCSPGSACCASGAARAMPRSLFVNNTKPSRVLGETMAKLRKPGLLPHCQSTGPACVRSMPQLVLALPLALAALALVQRASSRPSDGERRDPRTQPLTVEDALFTIQDVDRRIALVGDLDGDGLGDLVVRANGDLVGVIAVDDVIQHLAEQLGRSADLIRIEQEAEPRTRP